MTFKQQILDDFDKEFKSTSTPGHIDELFKDFISSALDRQIEEFIKNLEDGNLTTIYYNRILASHDNPMVSLKDVKNLLQAGLIK